MTCENGDVDQAINLIDKGYEVNAPNEGGVAPLVDVNGAKQIDACDVLIGSQPDINVQAQDGYLYCMTELLCAV